MIEDDDQADGEERFDGENTYDWRSELLDAEGFAEMTADRQLG